VVGVEQWAEVRRLHFVRGLSIHEIHRRTGLHRETIRRALRSDAPPCYVRAPKGSKLDPFKDEIHRLLREDPALTGCSGSSCRSGRSMRSASAPRPRSKSRTSGSRPRCSSSLR
jgi:hypothetical protein